MLFRSKGELVTLKDEVKKLRERMQIVVEELQNFSRKDEVSLLRRQFKMFEPLQFARIEDVEKIIDEKIHREGKEHFLLEKDKRGYIL